MRSLQLRFPVSKPGSLHMRVGRWLRVGWFGWSVGVLGAMCCLYAGVRYVHAQHHVAAQRLRIQVEQQRQRDELASESAASTIRPNYVADKRWRRAATELQWPWLDTLAALESMGHGPVYLTELSAKPADATWQLNGEAGAYNDVLLFLQELQRVPYFSGAQLLSHEMAQDPGGKATLRFSVQASWITLPRSGAMAGKVASHE